MEDVIYLPDGGQRTLGNFGEQPKEYTPDIAKAIYPRNWGSYILARQKEKPLALEILSEAIRILNVKTYGKNTGRPPFPLSDKLFLCVQKVLRATTYDANEEHIEFSKLKNYISSKPRPHSVSDFMNDPQLTPLLEQLIVLTSTPMVDFEKRFAVDATGLSTFDKSRWVKVRLEHHQHRAYKKLHTIVGTSSNIIVAAKVTIGTQHDSPMLNPLLELISKYFKVKEVSGDGAYCSRENAQDVEDIGAVPYFKIRKDVRALAKGHYPAWNKMIHRFWDNKEKYNKHYHFRSNVESTYSMFKRKISEYVRSKTDVAKVNEALCLAVSHNLFVLVNAFYCEDIDVKFKV